MRADLVVLVPKEIKDALLSRQCSLGRLCRFRLERSVHPLMTAVLFWVSWLDALREYSELNPPDRKLGEPAHRFGRERRAVVSADSPRQSKFDEGALEVRSDVLFVGDSPADVFAARNAGCVPVAAPCRCWTGSTRSTG